MIAPGNLRSGGAAIYECVNRERRFWVAINDGDGQMEKGQHCNSTMAVEQFTHAPTKRE
jgi:hypothetical protein